MIIVNYLLYVQLPVFTIFTIGYITAIVNPNAWDLKPILKGLPKYVCASIFPVINALAAIILLVCIMFELPRTLVELVHLTKTVIKTKIFKL